MAKKRKRIKKRIILKVIEEKLYISDRYNRIPFSTKKGFLKWVGEAWIFVSDKPTDGKYNFYCFSQDEVGIYAQESEKI